MFSLSSLSQGGTSGDGGWIGSAGTETAAAACGLGTETGRLSFGPLLSLPSAGGVAGWSFTEESEGVDTVLLGGVGVLLCWVEGENVIVFACGGTAEEEEEEDCAGREVYVIVLD